MGHFLSAQAVSIVTYDPPGTVAAATVSILERLLKPSQLRLDFTRSELPDLGAPLPHSVGLAMWSVTSEDSVSHVSECIAKFRLLQPQAFTIVLLRPELIAWERVLIESRVHLLLHYLSDLQNELRSALDRIPLSMVDRHPLTEGLLAKLP